MSAHPNAVAWAGSHLSENSDTEGMDNPEEQELASLPRSVHGIRHVLHEGDKRAIKPFHQLR